MGVRRDIRMGVFPPQGSALHRQVKVILDYDTPRHTTGKVVRDDVSDPWLMIIQLEDGRFVLSTECMYSYFGS
jgi:hypothetical protein